MKIVNMYIGMEDNFKQIFQLCNKINNFNHTNNIFYGVSHFKFPVLTMQRVY